MMFLVYTLSWRYLTLHSPLFLCCIDISANKVKQTNTLDLNFNLQVKHFCRPSLKPAGHGEEC